MTTAQHKIGSGFGADSTAAEVLDGVDLGGTLAVVTGGYSGIGLETTRALGGAGAHVVVPAGAATTADEALAGIDGVEVDELDLGDLDSVRAFAERFLAAGRPIDILIDNAGIMASPRDPRRPGWEAQFATNHLGHFALVNRLWPALAAAAAPASSRCPRAATAAPAIRWDDVKFDARLRQVAGLRAGQDGQRAVRRRSSTRSAREPGVRAFALHPGGIMTPLQRHLAAGGDGRSAAGSTRTGNAAGPSSRRPEQGAATQVWAATSPQLDGLGGVYCEDCDIAEPATPTPPCAAGCAGTPSTPNRRPACGRCRRADRRGRVRGGLVIGAVLNSATRLLRRPSMLSVRTR